MKILGLGLVGAVLLAAGTATAGPSMRFGLTVAPTDQSAPNEHELGPMVALGERVGPLTLEADYAYLSFMSNDTTQHGMQRLGVNLRADLFSNVSARCRMMMACTRRNAFYVEGGVAERYGQWHLDAQTLSPSDTNRTHEEHVGIGIELDNHVVPYRYGWQFAVRFAMSPHDDLMETCRGATCSMGSQVGGQDKAVLVEWAFLIGS